MGSEHGAVALIGRWLGTLAAAGTLFLLTAGPATAAGPTAVQVSEDPFTNPAGQHRTEVEPDTFSFGTTWVSAFQVGRSSGSGALDIGWATSRDAGHRFVHGFLPGVTTSSQPAGAYDRASDASVAFDLRHHAWLISFLGIRAPRAGMAGALDVLVSRSPDGVHWGLPVPVAAGQGLDKNWTVCDNSRSSPHFGNCYTEFDVASRVDLVQMSTSSDGGLTWGPPLQTADAVHGQGGQPLVQADGRVVVPIQAFGSFPGVGESRGLRAFASDDGGATWSASVAISTITAHRPAGGALRSPVLPSAEVDGLGRIYVAWQDCRFESGCAANDIVMSTSDDGTTWSPVRRVPIDPLGSGADHVTPGLGVDRISFGDHARLALTYYVLPDAGCVPTTCQLEVGFVTSRNGGASWSAPRVLAGPMSLAWLPRTVDGAMVADYISTSFTAGTHVRPAFAAASPPPATGRFEQAIFTAREDVRDGDVPTAADTVVFFPGSGRPGVDEGGNDDDAPDQVVNVVAIS